MKYRVLRGGSCFSDTRDLRSNSRYWDLRSSSRYWDVPDNRSRDDGFRIVVKRRKP